MTYCDSMSMTSTEITKEEFKELACCVLCIVQFFAFTAISRVNLFVQVYLFVSSQRISGCLVAEPIKEAFKIIAPLDDKRQLKKKRSSPSTTIHFGDIVLQREVSKRCPESDDRLDNRAIVFEEEAKPAVCGVRAIWVSPSNRRKGLATQLLDTAR